MTSAERQSRRQDKLRKGFSECERLRSDVNTTIFAINVALKSLRSLADDSPLDLLKSINVCCDNIQDSVDLLDSEGEGRRKDDIK